MSQSSAKRDIRPLRWMLLAVLSGVALAQIVWMVSLTRSQVEKAAQFYAAERSGTTVLNATSPAPSAPSAAPAGLVSVSYVSAR